MRDQSGRLEWGMLAGSSVVGVLVRLAALAILAGVLWQLRFSPQVPDAPLPQPPPPPRTSVVLGGDVMLSRNVGRLARESGDPARPFRELAPLLSAAGIAFVNLEAPFSDQGPVQQEGMIFKAEPEMIQGLQLAGIDVVSTANNHARDRRGYGLEYTLDWLASHGIAATGTGKSVEEAHRGVVLEGRNADGSLNGVRFGFLAYTYDANNGNWPDQDPRINITDIAAMRADVAAMRLRADVIIVSMHAGQEYLTTANQDQIDFAHAAIEAGASVVAGHHPHVEQPWEAYQGGLIFYSLGNLVFDQRRPGTRRGALAALEFEAGSLRSARLLPVEIRGGVARLMEQDPLLVFPDSGSAIE